MERLTEKYAKESDPEIVLFERIENGNSFVHRITGETITPEFQKLESGKSIPQLPGYVFEGKHGDWLRFGGGGPGVRNDIRKVVYDYVTGLARYVEDAYDGIHEIDRVGKYYRGKIGRTFIRPQIIEDSICTDYCRPSLINEKVWNHLTDQRTEFRKFLEEHSFLSIGGMLIYGSHNNSL